MDREWYKIRVSFKIFRTPYGCYIGCPGSLELLIVPEANRNIRYNRIRSDHLSREGRKLVLEIVSF